MKINTEYVLRFQEISYLLLGINPPHHLIYEWNNGEWENNEDSNLQQFFVEHLKLHWMTGIDTIEAIEKIIKEAVGNANLRDDWSIA